MCLFDELPLASHIILTFPKLFTWRVSLEDFKFPISKYVLSFVLTANLLLPKTSNWYTLSAVEPIQNEVSQKPLVINKFGIPEPISEMVKYPDVLLVPLVAFDKNFNRIGYGGGFYDRYIKKIRNQKKVLTIGFAYSFQKVKKIPTNNYDIKLDFIITNK